MNGICGTAQVINGFLVWKNIKPIIDPLFLYDEEEYVLFTKSENVTFHHKKCLLIGNHKNFTELTIDILISELTKYFNLDTKPIINNYENPYYLCWKIANQTNDYYEEYIEPNINLPTYVFKELNQISNLRYQTIFHYILGIITEIFKHNGNHYLIYYYEITKHMIIKHHYLKS